LLAEGGSDQQKGEGGGGEESAHGWGLEYRISGLWV
jgi:hypothetical protein